MVNSLGQSLAPEDSQDADDSYDRALQVAYRFVGFRPRSVGEVRRRLSKDFAADLVDRVVSTFIRYGYLDDAEFARQWRASRERRNPHGFALLRRELRDKGVAGALIDATLDDVDDAENAYRAGRRRAERWLGSDGLAYHVFRRRMWDYLQRRGFGGGVAHQTVARLWGEFSAPDAA